jgi:hypothetical protein
MAPNIQAKTENDAVSQVIKGGAAGGTPEIIYTFGVKYYISTNKVLRIFTKYAIPDEVDPYYD